MPRRRPVSRLTGPATRAMAHEAGITDRQLQHPGVRRLSRDTYLPQALAGELVSRLAPVLLTAPPGAVVSHATAATLWGIAIPLQRADDVRVDLTVPMSSPCRCRPGRRAVGTAGCTARHSPRRT